MSGFLELDFNPEASEAGGCHAYAFVRVRSLGLRASLLVRDCLL